MPGDPLTELPAPSVPVRAPPFSYVRTLILERQRLYGTAGVSGIITASGLERMDMADASRVMRRSKHLRNREIRLRRMMLIEPRLPKNYRKTAQTIRVGQSLLADMAIRVPAMLAAKPFQVRADPIDDEDESLRDATLKEAWTHSMLLGHEGRRAILDAGVTSVWRDFYDNLVSAGEGVFQVLCRRDRWGEGVVGYPAYDSFQDDGDRVPEGERKSAAGKYLRAVQNYRKVVPPFTLESLDPLMIHQHENQDGISDEAIVVGQRPYRHTLAHYGLVPTRSRGPDVYEGAEGTTRYLAGPNGLGKAFPIRDFPTGRYQPESVESVTYYCSSVRAQYLGLLDTDEPDIGVWSQYIDGVLVDYGPLWGPPFHPLPLFRTPGLGTAIPDPNFQGIPLALHIMELTDLLDQIMTMELHIAFWSSFPPVLEEDSSPGGVGATGVPSTVLADPETLVRPGGGSSRELRTLEPARFYQVPPGKKWRYFVMPPESTAHLERLYTKARELFDLLGIPGVFRGVGGARQPGYAIAQLMVAARSLFDPLVDNATACVQQAVMYTWWQVWRRFPEGVPVYAHSSDGENKRGWIELHPKNIAPDGRGAGEGVPFLQCSVHAEPLMPVDEAQREARGIQAVESGMMDEDSARTKYFEDEAPEKTAARILANKAMQHAMVQLPLIYRAAVRMGVLMPELAVAALAKELGVDPALAFEQLRQNDTFTPSQASAVQGLLAQRSAMAPAMGGELGPVPGVPGLPGPAVPAPQQAIAPTPPPAPPILSAALRQGPGIPLNTGGQPQQQPSVAARQLAEVV